MCQKHKYLFIYKTINLINGKIYVGQHQADKLEDGYIGCGICYESDAQSNIFFHRAVRKHKYENFKREIIEFCESREQLNEREIFWIRELSSQNSEVGYNINSGGQNPDIYYHEYTDEQREDKRQFYLSRPIRTCQYCGFQSRTLNMNKYHFENCKKNPNYIPKPDIRELLTCPHCNYQSRNSGSIRKNHFDHCKQNLNYIQQNNYKQEEHNCPHCGLVGRGGNMKRYHFDNCKHKQRVA